MTGSDKGTISPVENAGDVSSNDATPEKVVSNPIANIPNGGLFAWLQVLASFFLYCTTWGLIQSYGVFESYYKTTLLSHRSQSDLAWIGSIQTFLFIFAGVLAGPAFDKGYVRYLLLGGSGLVLLGTMTISAATQYYQIFLAQGISVGLGCGLLFVPTMSVVAQYFTTKRPLAMGLASLGSGVGGIIYSIVFHQLQPKIGFPWTVRVLGFITLALLAISSTAVKSRAPPGPSRRLVDVSMFNEVSFTLVAIAAFVGLMGIYVPFYEVQLFAITELGAGETLTFYLIPIMNAGSILGRLIFSTASAKLGVMNLYTASFFLAGIIHLSWISVDTIPEGVLFSVFYGFASGGILALAPIVITVITKDLRKLGTRIGTAFGTASFGLLAGNPIAGALVDSTGKGDYKKAQVFGGVMLLGAGVISLSGQFLTARGREIFRTPRTEHIGEQA
ncbi:MAG: hypothetical protein Q9227_007866 [Pyrenula ochraceoflavens]